MVELCLILSYNQLPCTQKLLVVGHQMVWHDVQT